MSNLNDTKSFLIAASAIAKAALFLFEKASEDPTAIQDLSVLSEYCHGLRGDQIDAVHSLTLAQRGVINGLAAYPNHEVMDSYFSRAHSTIITEYRRRKALRVYGRLRHQQLNVDVCVSACHSLCNGIMKLRQLTGNNDIKALIDEHQDDAQPVNLVELLNVAFRLKETFTKDFASMFADMHPEYGLIPVIAQQWIEHQSGLQYAKTPDIGTSPSDPVGKVFFWAQQLRPTTTQSKDCEVACRALLFVPAFMQDLAAMSALHVNEMMQTRTKNPAYTNQILAVWKMARAIDGVVHFDQPAKAAPAVKQSGLYKPVTGMDGARRAILVIGEAYQHFRSTITEQYPFAMVGDIVTTWEPELLEMIKEFPESLFYAALGEADHEYVQPAKQVYEYLNPDIALRREVGRQMAEMMESLFERGIIPRPAGLPTAAEISTKGIDAKREFESMVEDLKMYGPNHLQQHCEEWLGAKYHANAMNLLRFSNSAVCEVRTLEYPVGNTRDRAVLLRSFLREKARSNTPPVTDAAFV